MKTRDKKTAMSASDLAQMGTCERLVFFEARYGRRPSAGQRQAMARGRTEHRSFFQDAVAAKSGARADTAKPWCFCASLAWSPRASQTRRLRRFRGLDLRKSAGGRWLTRLYYKNSTARCRRHQRHPILVVALRLALTPAVWLASAVTALRDLER